VYENRAKERKQADLNPCCRFLIDNNYGLESDPKIRAMEEINFIGGRTSHMRKIFEQMSNPIFGSSYSWQPREDPSQPETIIRPDNHQQTLNQAKSL
jgi:hypothetical protein